MCCFLWWLQVWAKRIFKAHFNFLGSCYAWWYGIPLKLMKRKMKRVLLAEIFTQTWVIPIHPTVPSMILRLHFHTFFSGKKSRQVLKKCVCARIYNKIYITFGQRVKRTPKKYSCCCSKQFLTKYSSYIRILARTQRIASYQYSLYIVNKNERNKKSIYSSLPWISVPMSLCACTHVVDHFVERVWFCELTEFQEIYGHVFTRPDWICSLFRYFEYKYIYLFINAWVVPLFSPFCFIRRISRLSFIIFRARAIQLKDD